MFTTVVWVNPPLVADTETAYVPGVVRRDAETVSVTAAVPPAVKATFDALRDAVGSEGESPPVRLVGLTFAVRPMLPEKPLMPASVSVDWREEPIGIASDAGFATILKSTMSTLKIIERLRFPLVPVTVTA